LSLFEVNATPVADIGGYAGQHGVVGSHLEHARRAHALRGQPALDAGTVGAARAERHQRAAAQVRVARAAQRGMREQHQLLDEGGIRRQPGLRHLAAHEGRTQLTGAHLPPAAAPGAIAALPPTLKAGYLHAFTAALHPVFLSATAIAVIGFALTWLLEDLPLRGPVRAETVGESFAMPHDATSLEELEMIVTRLQARETHWEFYSRVAQSLDLALPPDRIWLLVQVCRSGPVSVSQLAARFGVALTRLDTIAAQLVADGMIAREAGQLSATQGGRALFDRMVEAHRRTLHGLAARWSPEQHEEAKAMLDGLARNLIAEIPIAPAGQLAQR